MKKRRDIVVNALTYFQTWVRVQITFPTTNTQRAFDAGMTCVMVVLWMLVLYRLLHPWLKGILS